MRPACERRLPALPVLTYPKVRSAPVLGNRHFSARPDLNLNTPQSMLQKTAKTFSHPAFPAKPFA
ncbi:hypothetical protein BQ8482_110639 [Mesorhizobium delmotii]|uniref:Uncharacterized protein n=1 Tax=Mesorhizobium delmotii TaxID=1631247 RepID=A0A2P9AC52_9HYPH|nr:hypothetical protein BQ8482_110639 [Mesorhizobium delmotii]